MSENSKPKKLRIYKYASEVNLSSDSLVEFLQEKGYSVKSHMTLLTDEMLNDIQQEFKKDIESSEKHYKKISEFQQLRSDRNAAENESETETVQTETAVEEEKAEEVEVADDTEETSEEVSEDESTETEEVETEDEAEEVSETVEEPEAEIPVDEEAETVEEEVQETVEAKDEVEPVTEETTEAPVDEPVVEDKKEIVEENGRHTKEEIDKKYRRGGLKVVGKIDLSKPKKKKPEPAKKDKTRVAKLDKNGKPIPTNAQNNQQQPSSEDENKKKKKILKAKKKTKPGDAKDEPVHSKKKRKLKKQAVDKKDVDAAIKRTMLSMDGGAGSATDRANVRKKKRKEKQEVQEKIQEAVELEKTVLKVTEYIAVNELANLMNVEVSDVIAKCIGLGLMVSINQRLDLETITLVADEFSFEVELQEEYTADVLEDIEDAVEDLKPRPPVVTIMGHVDHGKTSLLDYVRRENVVAGEAGGITQHIGAYKVEVEKGKEIAFLDTPGHEAFTAMRARGAKVTDIVILIVAADDAVMPQTVEAINHSQAAGVPIIIAINKVDRPTANVEKIKQQLADRNVLVEDWGGKYQCVEISAKMGTNVDLLLEKVLLEAELLELTANPDRLARGTVVESQLDKGRGITATVLIQKGVLRIGDPFVAGNVHGRVRAMFDERNNKITEAGPSTPVLVLGFENAPQAGDTFVIVGSEREAREVSLKRQQLKREQDRRQVKLITLDQIATQISEGAVKELPLVVKGDVDGSVEALADSLMKLSNNEVAVRVIHKAVGAITEGDVLLAAASGAIIIGFHVRPNLNARKLAESEKVDIRLYNVIYDTINEIRSALEGMLSPLLSEEMVATIEVRETFKVPKLGTVAGCYVQDGKITRANKIRLFRDGIVVYEGSLATLKRFKDDVKEVDAGYECGLNINNFNDIKVGDIIESYKIIETKKKMDD